MYKERYQHTYIECYKKIIDTVEIIKDFLYPGKYKFHKLDENLTIDNKLKYITKDLESLNFTSEVDCSLIELLEKFFPDEDKVYNEQSYIELVELGKNKIDDLYEKLKNRYFPFIKIMAVEGYPDRWNTQLSDDEIWNTALKNNVDYYAEKVEEVIWAIMDSENEDLIDKVLRESYHLNELEYARYINGKNNPNTSIEETNEEHLIDCDFSSFNDLFNDIYGQDKAIKTIEKVLKRNIFLYNAEDLSKVKKRKNPLATFMFYGPTGTGKTECAKRIAEFIYGEERKLLLLDMNSYKDGKIGSSAIKGHPEGYVNSEKGTDFTRFLKSNPGGVIVLDEFEKADPEVREIFMTMLDEGEFKDALGNIYDLSAYIFIATTNASESFETNKKTSIGFNTLSKEEETKEQEKDIKDGLRKVFTAPIMNRFNNLVHFKKIEYNDALKICVNLINTMCDIFQSKKFKGLIPSITVENIEKIAEIILKECNYEEDGVRSLKNVINDVIGSEIIEQILNKNKDILIYCKDNKIKVQKRMIPTV